MLKVFYGENRVKANDAIQKFLGKNYEVIEGSNLTATDLPSLFYGTSLFSSERAILIRDILTNKTVADELIKYLDSPYKVAILELKIDKRSSAYKALQTKITFTEFTMPRDKEAGIVFDIYKIAKRDGAKAVKMLDRIKASQEPMMFLGLMISQALRDYQAHPQGAKEKRALHELSKLDIDLKSSKIAPWTLISAFLLRLSSR
ncbi:hypothetical protein IKG05_01770 [Candidatus Saccharibacteria bacterium]|nr:hypothetical protein [Candidatus Saccharibacteria bacterium]